MIKPEQIPDEAWNAAYIAFVKSRQQGSCLNLRELISEAINAWPNAQQRVFPAYSMETGHYEVPALVLFMFPPEEKNDD